MKLFLRRYKNENENLLFDDIFVVNVGIVTGVR